MEEDNKKPQTDILNKAQQLLSDVKIANADFDKKAGDIVNDINNEFKKDDDEFGVSEKEMENIEKDAVNKMDTAVLEFISGADEILKEEKDK